LKFGIDIHTGLTKEKGLEIARALEMPADDHNDVAETLVKLYDLFVSKDATMVEINPFAEDAQGGCKFFFLL
jgi:succinyl-CoA synthetase beta subunit